MRPVRALLVHEVVERLACDGLYPLLHDAEEDRLRGRLRRFKDSRGGQLQFWEKHDGKIDGAIRKRRKQDGGVGKR